MHIADVSSFVRPGSMTDLEARERSTTVYLADRRYDMLPPVLSADICSLLSNVDRCVYVCVCICVCACVCMVCAAGAGLGLGLELVFVCCECDLRARAKTGLGLYG